MGANRTQPDAEIEAIVRETLARLALRQGEQNKTSAMSERGKIPGAGENLALADRLITAATLRDRLAGIKNCVVPPRAVVTPAARDLLRDRDVTLTFAGTDARDPRDTARQSAGGLMLAAAETTFDPAPLAAALGREGMTIERVNASGFIAALDAVSEAVGADDKRAALLLTREAPAAVCLANRIAGARAAAATSVRETKNAIRSVGANVIVVDPAQRTFWDLMQIARACAARGPRVCPPSWKDRLR